MESRRRTILVVDDSEQERRIFSAYLEFVGFRVITAADGAEGVRKAQSEDPDMILLDLCMPVLDGWEAIRRLRESPGTESIPVVAVTAAAVDELALRRHGFSGYVAKPIAPFDVLQEVERCMGWKAAPAPAVRPAPARGQPRFGRRREAAYGGGSASD